MQHAQTTDCHVDLTVVEVSIPHLFNITMLILLMILDGFINWATI
jgi:hypothetical protein